jgi:hypothetical protein
LEQSAGSKVASPLQFGNVKPLLNSRGLSRIGNSYSGRV